MPPAVIEAYRGSVTLNASRRRAERAIMRELADLDREEAVVLPRAAERAAA